MLHDLALDEIEVERSAAIGVVVVGHLIQTARARIAGRRPPVDAGGRRRVDGRRTLAEPRRGGGRVDRLDRRVRPRAFLQRVVLVGDAGAEHREPDRAAP